MQKKDRIKRPFKYLYVRIKILRVKRCEPLQQPFLYIECVLRSDTAGAVLINIGIFPARFSYMSLLV